MVESSIRKGNICNVLTTQMHFLNLLIFIFQNNIDFVFVVKKIENDKNKTKRKLYLRKLNEKGFQILVSRMLSILLKINVKYKM